MRSGRRGKLTRTGSSQGQSSISTFAVAGSEIVADTLRHLFVEPSSSQCREVHRTAVVVMGN
jgi:hypothetical protein